MTKKQIEYMCDDNKFRKEMLDIVMAEIGTGQFLVIREDGSVSGIPKEALYDTCIAMVGDACFYIDGENGLSKLILPFKNKTRDSVTKEERKSAIMYAEDCGIKMPSNFYSLFYKQQEIIPYMSPAKNIISGEKEKAYFASVLSDSIKNHRDAFLKGTRVSEKDLCDEIVCGYNKKLLNNMVFCKDIENYPEDCPVHRLAAYAFSVVRNKWAGYANTMWMTKNVTSSMDEADFKLFRVITSIKKPVYEKAAGNKTQHTFDTIRVWFSLVSKEYMPERNAFIKENKKGFARLALACIQDDKRYVLPVNLLKIDHIGITSQSQLEFIFSLKDDVTALFEIEGG